MSIKVVNDTNNGSATLKAPNVAGDVNITTPAFTTELAPRMQLMTAQNSTSGTSIDFTGIPSWAKKITVMFHGVSASGTSPIQIQLGTSGGIQNTGYSGSVWFANTVNVSNSSGILVNPIPAGGHVVDAISSFHMLNQTTNAWVASVIGSRTDAASGISGSGAKMLSGTLDRIRVTTVNGTDTFDAGQINVLYEG